MGNTHADRCVADVLGKADELKRAIDRGLNPEACEGILSAYVEQPAFYPQWRGRLIDIAMVHIFGKTRAERIDEAIARVMGAAE